MRHVGIDVGRDFAHVAVVEGAGMARNLGQIRMGAEFEAFVARAGPGVRGRHRGVRQIPGRS